VSLKSSRKTQCEIRSAIIDTAPTVSRPIPVRADVHLDRLRDNVSVLRTQANDASLMAVVKANAYGHGMTRVARALRAEGVRHFAVANVPEGARLREAGLEAPIQVFAAPLAEHLPAYARHDLGVTVSSPAVAKAVVETATAEAPLRAHVKVETGMGRIGLARSEAERALRRLADAPHVRLVSLWTHFATADERDPSFTRKQLRRFRALLDELPNALLDEIEHVDVANSAALLALPDEATAFTGPLIRTGLALYGVAPREDMTDRLRPVMRFTARVTHLKTVTAGAPVSYGRTWIADAPSRIATVGAGYADGYPRLLSNRAEVGIRGRRYPVVGNVCMDMLMVNLGAPGGEGAAVEVGDEVVLVGEGGPSVHELACWAETIPYEIMTSVGPRVPRRYLAAKGEEGEQCES
jgi:alanine racemase